MVLGSPNQLVIQFTMPWVSSDKYRVFEQYKEYNQLTNADLKERLTHRGLRHTGKKAAMVLRLTEDDEAR